MKLKTVETNIQKRPSLENINPETALEALSWAKTFSPGTFYEAPGKGLERGSSRKVIMPLLLVSDDAGFSRELRRAVERNGRSLVHTGEVRDALHCARVVPLAAILLDLDLPAQKAWRTADGLLQEEACPPLILLTARADDVEFGAAIGAGSLLDKSVDPTLLLGIVNRTLLDPRPDQAVRNANQRALIRWLRPCIRPGPGETSRRFWGINE